MSRCRPRLLLSTAALAAGLAASLTGCGHAASSTPATSPVDSASGTAASYARTPAAQITRDVEAALQAASSLHMAGSIVEGGDQIDFDISVDTSGDCTGTMGLGGTTLRLLGASGSYYIKAPRAFWAAQDESHAAQVWSIVGGKWVKMTGGSQRTQMSSLCDLTEFTKSLFGKNDDSVAKVVGPSQFHGQPTVELSGRSDAGAPTTIQVLAAAPHYPVRLDAGAQGEMTFSRFDVPVTVAAPSPAQTVDLGRLQ